MTTINIQDTTANILPSDNLTQPLQSSVFIPMEASKGKKLAAGNRWSKLIKKGENSKLPMSVAVEVPVLRSIAAYMEQGAIVEAVTEYIASLQDAYIKSRAVAGALSIQYSELTPGVLAEFLATSEDSGRIGQLSSERITTWFEADARDLLIVALADRLGIAENATDAEVKRLEQIANQTRDNLAKLSSKKPVHFDARVLAALNWALDVTATGDNMSVRLKDKLNMKADELDLGAALGF